MRINQFLALATGISRRAADRAITSNQVTVNGQPAQLGQTLAEGDMLVFENRPFSFTEARAQAPRTTIMLNKPAGYVVSRQGQGSKTIYSLLPAEYHHLKPVGRLDKNSSGLLLLTNDGSLAHELTHPSRQKTKVYNIQLDKPLQPLHRQMISDYGVQLEDGSSRLQLDRLRENNDTEWQVTMHEGRNRQIRRTFAALGYSVNQLHRTHFGDVILGNLAPGTFRKV